MALHAQKYSVRRGSEQTCNSNRDYVTVKKGAFRAPVLEHEIYTSGREHSLLKDFGSTQLRALAELLTFRRFGQVFDPHHLTLDRPRRRRRFRRHGWSTRGMTEMKRSLALVVVFQEACRVVSKKIRIWNIVRMAATTA